MYQVEHDELFASICSGNHINDGESILHSSMMAIMGRMSAHTGKEITWDDAMAADEDLFAAEADMQWDQIYDPGPVAVSGVTQIPGIGRAGKNSSKA